LVKDPHYIEFINYHIIIQKEISFLKNIQRNTKKYKEIQRMQKSLLFLIQVLIGTLMLSIIPLFVIFIDKLVEVYRQREGHEDYKLLGIGEMFAYVLLLMLSVIISLKNVDAFLDEGIVKTATIILIGPVVNMSSIYLTESIKQYLSAELSLSTLSKKSAKFLGLNPL